MSELFNFQVGERPLLVSIPHAGTLLPASMATELSAGASSLPDTDWFVDRLYDWVPQLGAGLITARYSRYLIDLNRPPDDAALYRSETPGLIPLRTFSGTQVYTSEPPDAKEVAMRLSRYWQPYHRAIQHELERMREKFGYAILFDAHSIRSRVPGLFDGVLPDLNLGSFAGRSAAPGLVETAMNVIEDQDRYSHVKDGRFKGGFITRHYGRPEQNIHALQLEMAQTVYMHEDPPVYAIEAASRAREFLRILLSCLIEWSPVMESR